MNDSFFEVTWQDKLLDVIGRPLSHRKIKNAIEEAVTSVRSPMVVRMQDAEEDERHCVYGEMQRKWRVTVDMHQPRQSLKNEDNWERDTSLKHYIWHRHRKRGREMMAGDKYVSVRGDDYDLGDHGILKKFDMVQLDGRKYDFLGYYREKDWMMFKLPRVNGIKPDETLSEEEFQKLREEEKFRRVLPDHDNAVELPDWIDNSRLVAYRVFDRDAPEAPFVGFDEDRRAVFIDECCTVIRYEMTPKDLTDSFERTMDGVDWQEGVEGIVRQIVNEDWDWVHPRYRWMLKNGDCSGG